MDGAIGHEIQARHMTYFTPQELRCKCGNCTGTVKKKFLKKLNYMREDAGFPFILTSAYRCPEYNSQVSTTGRTGPHTTGRAVDIRCYGARAYEVVRLAYQYGMTGIGVSQKGVHGTRFIHIDDLKDSPLHPRPWTWTY